MRSRLGIQLAVASVLVAILACSFPLSAPPTATPGDVTLNSGASGGGGGGGGAGGSGSIVSPPVLTRNPTPAETPTEGPTPSPAGSQGPYLVKQTHSLGGEVISGQVCSLIKPFTVTSAAPKVTFTFNFVPIAADHGNLAYAYSLPSAGESHDARGTYVITQASSDGTLLLSMAVSDHVVFKGFDGNMPVKYDFKLVPSTQTSCPDQ
jgi:hypothetical protein